MSNDFFIIWVLILGIYSMAADNGVFGFAFTWMYDKEEELRSVLFQPFLVCISCMASLWTCVYFGVKHGAYLQLVIFVGNFGYTALFNGIDFYPDWLAKWTYLISVGVFIYLLPCENIEAIFCIVGISGVNYQISYAISAIEARNIE